MTIMVEPLKDVEAWKASEGHAIPVGDHVTEIEDVKEGMSSTQNPQVEITWRVVDGDYRGATSREWVSITRQSLGKVKALLEAVGYTIPEGGFAMPTGELVGRRAYTNWREDTFNGKTLIKCMGHSPVPTATGGVQPDIPFDAPDSDLPF